MEKAKTRIRKYIEKLLAPNFMFYVISFERSGTHFMINTLLRNTYIKYKGYHSIIEWFGPYDNYKNRFNHIDSFNSEWDINRKKSSIIKSHCDYDLYRERYKKSKVIYMLRDPRDVLASYFNFINHGYVVRYARKYNFSLPNIHYKSFSNFLREPIPDFLRYNFSLNGNFINIPERWCNHVKGWLNAPDTLIMRYEDLKNDYADVLRKASNFVGLRTRLTTQPISVHNSWNVGPRGKGIIGNYKKYFSEEDEIFLKKTVEKFGLNYFSLIYHNGK
jgi:hypothetical protein